MKENWPKMCDKQKPKDPLAYQKQIRRNVFATWSGETRSPRGEEGGTCSPSGGVGNPFFWWGGERVRRRSGGKNVEGEWSEGKGCAWSGPKRTRSKSVAAEALAQISAWFTPVHAERERERQLSNGRRSEACRHAPLTCVCFLGVRFEFQKEKRKRERERGKLPQSKTVRECAITGEKFRSAFGLFFSGGFFWWFTVPRWFPSTEIEEDRRSGFRITRTRAYKGARYVFTACTACTRRLSSAMTIAAVIGTAYSYPADRWFSRSS